MDSIKSTGIPELDEKIKEYLEWDQNAANAEEIKNLLKANEIEELKKRLLTRLTFGTAGLRGLMQAGFNAMNDLVIVQTAQGLSKYILSCFTSAKDRKRGIIVGYDGRHHSERFAQLTACVFIHENIPVYLYSKTVITPFVPFGVMEKKCLAGVMVTASHNPKDDNGYKVYGQNGAQIIPPHDKNIQQNILENLVPLKSSWDMDLLASPLLIDPLSDVIDSYYKKLYENIPNLLIKDYNETSDMEFVYTAMHGVGYPYIERAFKVAKLKPVIPVVEQRDPDPEFPTVKFPNPEEGKSSLVLSIKLANETGKSIILANDPDADRMACAEKDPATNEWRVFTGNELGALLGWWAIECYKKANPNGNLKNCYVLASTVSSKMLKTIANMDGLNFIETLTGFKWMGNRAVELMAENKTVLFAFEEAIGFMYSTTVLDKDGVSAACHLATMCVYLKKTKNLSLSEKLIELYQKYGYHYTINSYYLCYEPKTVEIMFERIRNLTGPNEYPKDVLNGKYRISAIRDLTTGIDTGEPDGIAKFPVSKSSQMITFTFEIGVVVTIRTSGTEPKIKYYTEMCAKPENSDWDGVQTTLKEIVGAIVEEFLQPVKNNLTPRVED